MLDMDLRKTILYDSKSTDKYVIQYGDPISYSRYTENQKLIYVKYKKYNIHLYISDVDSEKEDVLIEIPFNYYFRNAVYYNNYYYILLSGMFNSVIYRVSEFRYMYYDILYLEVLKSKFMLDMIIKNDRIYLKSGKFIFIYRLNPFVYERCIKICYGLINTMYNFNEQDYCIFYGYNDNLILLNHKTQKLYKVNLRLQYINYRIKPNYYYYFHNNNFYIYDDDNIYTINIKNNRYYKDKFTFSKKLYNFKILAIANNNVYVCTRKN